MKKPEEYFSNWTLLHALVMSGAALGYYFLYERWLLWALPAISILAFVSRTGISMKVLPLNSPANWTTLLRLAGVLALFYFGIDLNPLYVGAFAIVLLILDWLDGWLAKKTGTTSDAGAILDKETDAILVLILCFLLFEMERMENWVLLIGLIRYIYVIGIHPLRKGRPEPSFQFGKWIAGVFIATLIAGFVIPQPYHSWAVMLGSVLIVYSFGKSLWYWLTTRTG